MFGIRMSLLVLLLSLVWTGAGGAAACGSQQSRAQQNMNTNANANQNKIVTATPEESPSRVGEKPMSNDFKVLAEGGHISVFDSFVVVARDAQTYAALRELNNSLPQMDAEFFKSSAVVAAFLGQRRTGGFSVDITSAGDGSVHVSEKAPPAGGMVMMVLTTPYKIVSVPLKEEAPLSLTLDKTWQEMMRPYRVGASEFNSGGGFAGRYEKLTLAGDVRVMRSGGLATFFFDLNATGAKKERRLKDVSSGVVGKDGSVVIGALDPDTLVDHPRPPLRATGEFTENEGRLSLSFTSLPTIVADGFGGTGRLEATATAPAPKSKAVTGDKRPM
jgi:hypothetical protein